MSDINTSAALEHFRHHDPLMADLLTTALDGPNPLTPPQPRAVEEYFGSLISSIISQQISVKAAAAVREKVLTQLGGQITPEGVLQHDFDTLKACGLSSQKTKYIRHNAALWHEIPSENFVHMNNETIISELTKLYGIGRWTAEMFLMFSLARPDVFSYGDYGLMQGLYQAYGYKPHYVRKIKNTVDSWSPHRTLASLALWHFKDNPPSQK